MTIQIDESLAKDLIYHRLRELDAIIKDILDNWQYDNIDDFVNDVKQGKLPENSIDDAIDLQNVTDKRNQIAEILE